MMQLCDDCVMMQLCDDASHGVEIKLPYTHDCSKCGIYLVCRSLSLFKKCVDKDMCILIGKVILE